MSGFLIPGDLALSDDETDLVFHEGEEVVKQQLIVGAQIPRTLWRYDLRRGIPYLNQVMKKGVTVQVLTQIFRDYIAETPGIATVDEVSLTFDRPARIMAVQFVATSELGGEISDTLEFEVLS